MAQRPEFSDEIQRHTAKLAKDPTSRVFAQLADAYRKEGLFEEAIRICREGLAVHPSYAAARVVLGRALMEHGDLEEAGAELQRALELVADNPLALRLLGDIAAQRDHAPEARAYYVRALRANPRDTEIREKLAALTEVAREDEASPSGPPGDSPSVDTQALETRESTIAPGGETAAKVHAGEAIELTPPPAATESAGGVPAEGEGVFEETPLPEPRPPVSTAPDPLASPTLAALYASQGFPDVAAAISAQLGAVPSRPDAPVEEERVRVELPREAVLGLLSSLREAARQTRRTRSTGRGDGNA